jgi:hypothetical protein
MGSEWDRYRLRYELRRCMYTCSPYGILPPPDPYEPGGEYVCRWMPDPAPPPDPYEEEEDCAFGALPGSAGVAVAAVAAALAEVEGVPRAGAAAAAVAATGWPCPTAANRTKCTR